jgi:phosphoribosylanthranilate isomerase
MIWVKICGTTNLHDAQRSVAAGANALGFIFGASPRRIDAGTARAIIQQFGGEVEAIGVFVNETPTRVAEVAEQAALTGVQLHGDETEDSLPEFRTKLGNRKLIKSLQRRELLQNPRKLDGYLAARSSFDAILLDSGSPELRGGTGATFAWDDALLIAREIRQTLPLIIAGGLKTENVARAIELFEPWGVDTVSGVESKPGEKDEAKLRDFVAAVRQTEALARVTE